MQLQFSLEFASLEINAGKIRCLSMYTNWSIEMEIKLIPRMRHRKSYIAPVYPGSPHSDPAYKLNAFILITPTANFAPVSF
jgi:hypothetical protein